MFRVTAELRIQCDDTIAFVREKVMSFGILFSGLPHSYRRRRLSRAPDAYSAVVYRGDGGYSAGAWYLDRRAEDAR